QVHQDEPDADDDEEQGVTKKCGHGLRLVSVQQGHHTTPRAASARRAGVPGAPGRERAGAPPASPPRRGSAGGGGSGGLYQTGSAWSLLADTAVGLSVAWPHATSSGRRAKSTTSPSRLKHDRS